MIRDYAEPLGKNKSPRVILEKKDKSKIQKRAENFGIPRDKSL